MLLLLIYIVSCCFWGYCYYLVMNKMLPPSKTGKGVRLITSLWMFFLPIAFAYLTYDVVVIDFLKRHYCKKGPHQKIQQTIEIPESVYWEDNVFPGFDNLSRRWMIEHYLDGIHLKTLVLNGIDNKIYLYRAKPQDFAESKILQKQIDDINKTIKGFWEKGRRYTDEEAKAVRKKTKPLYTKIETLQTQRLEIMDEVVSYIMAQKEVFSSSKDLPKIKYKIALNQIPLPIWQQKYIYSDKMKIIDQNKRKIIAWSQRFERYKYRFEPDLRGGQLLFETLCGEGYVLSFDDKILFPHIKKGFGSLNRNDLRRKTYKRNLQYHYRNRKST